MTQTAENFIRLAMLLAAMSGSVLAQDLPQEESKTEINLSIQSKAFTSVEAQPATRPEGRNGALLLTGLGLVVLTLRRREPARMLSRFD